MNPPNKEATGLQLPASMPEQVPPPTADNISEGLRGSAERPTAAERASGPSAAPSLSIIPPPKPPPDPLTTSPANDAAAVTQTSALMADDDNDLIEKEWVNKAKQIVERTRDDPYKQSEDLTIFKADYLKKRYGKTIKVSQ
jgi:hypothetical protein